MNNDNNNNVTNNFISFLSCIMSRMAYLKMPDMFQKYTMIMNTIPNEILKSIKNLKNEENIFEDTKVFSSMDDSYFKQTQNHKYIDIIKLKLPQQMNAIISKNIANLQEIKNPNVKIIEITNSNENKVFIIGDKNINSIFVVFRGTDSLKAMTSWANLFKDIKIQPCRESKNKFLMGIFKLCIETIHTIYYSVCYLANDFLDSKEKNSIKIFTTGHSLGGGLSTIFAYLWVGLKYKNIEKKASYISDKIVCIPLASPRVFNEFMVKHDLYDLVDKNIILMKRIVTFGDIFTTQPFYLKHAINKNSVSYCEQTNIKGKKIINYKKTMKCYNNKNKKHSKTKRQNPLLPHGNYMYINFYGLLNMKSKSTLQSEYNDTIASVFLSYTENERNIYKVANFILGEVRHNKTKKYTSFELPKNKYIHEKEDTLMDYKLFDYIIKNTQNYDEYLIELYKNKNGNIKDKYISHGRPILKLPINRMNIDEFMCITSNNTNKIIN